VTLRTLVIATLAGASIAGAASAAEFDDFQSMCVKTEADAAAALAAADAAGWMPLPQALLAQITSTSKGMEKAEGRLRSDPTGLQFMVVASGSGMFGGSTQRLAICMLGVAPAKAGLVNELAAWAAVPEEPSFSKDGAHGYVFSVEAGGHMRLDPKSAEMTAGRAKVAFAQSNPQVTMIAIGLPVK
jgi:hypothetical protein